MDYVRDMEDNIKTDHRKTGCEGVDKIQLYVVLGSHGSKLLILIFWVVKPCGLVGI